MVIFFQNYWALFLLPLVVFYVFYIKKMGKSRKHKDNPTITFSDGDFFNSLPETFKIKLEKNLVYLRALVLGLLIIALARPQSPLEGSKIETEGIDIVLAIDVSTSMLAQDFTLGGKHVDRLQAVLDVVKGFIKGRNNDRIGIVVFGSKAYTISPLTLDYGWLLQNLERVKIGMVEDGTAIGSGITIALNRLKDTKAKGKVIILLTDGRNNSGKVSPLTAAEAAKALRTKIYTIGAGTKGLARYPVKDLFGETVYQPVKIDIDEDTLQKIADITSGKYFRATDTESLRKIYAEIDKLEKTIIEEKGYLEHKELYVYFVWAALLLLISEFILRNTILRKLP